MVVVRGRWVWRWGIALALSACGSGEQGEKTETVLPPSTAGSGASVAGMSGGSAGSPGAGGGPVQGGAGVNGGAGSGVLPMAGTGAAGMDVPMAGASGMGEAGSAGTGMTPPTPRGDLCLQGSATTAQNGPYQVATMDVNLGGSVGAYTVFYPTNMEADCKHPIVAWGNGTGVEGSPVYAHYSNHAASYGIVSIASHNSNVGSGEFHRAGIDWLLAQNDDPSSMFHQKLSGRAGVSGHSQGGIGATAASSHANVEAEVCVQGGGVPASGVAFMCLTGTEDFVNGACTSAYNAASGPAFLADYEGADHINTPTPLGITTPAGQEYIRLYTAWFRCFLADDADACALFEGSCPVCSEPGWANIEGKNL